MRKAPAYAEVYNDLDEEVVNLFRVLRDKEMGLELQRLLELTPFSRVELAAAYEPTGNLVERARRLVIRSIMGFGSNAHNLRVKTGFRANSNRSGTTPAHDWVHYPCNLPRIVERLREVIVENRPAQDILRLHDGEETLHYVDPPYVHSTRRRQMEHNYNHEMTDKDHANLAEVLKGLVGMVVLSGYDCPLYQELYAGWKKVSRKALADGARKRVETLWFNDKAWAAQPAPAMI